MRIAGFDISSTTIGWAILDVNKNKIKLYKYGYIKPLEKENLFFTLSKTIEQVIDILIKFKVKEVAIEDIMSYMPKKSSANTIIKLAVFNRSIGLAIYEKLNIMPHFYNVLSIRHGLKINTKLPDKLEMPNLVERILQFELKKEFKKNGKIKDEYYDQADAISCGIYHCLQQFNFVINENCSLKKNKEIIKASS